MGRERVGGPLGRVAAARLTTDIAICICVCHWYSCVLRLGTALRFLSDSNHKIFFLLRAS